MGFTARRLVWPAAAMVGVAAILGVLAFLQYRWATQISDNEYERMRTQLRTATGQFRQDFYRDLVSASAVFQVDSELLASRDWTRFNARYEEWQRNPANTELVSSVYIWDMKASQGNQELQLDHQAGGFVAGKFPEHIRKMLQSTPWRAPGGTLRRISWTFEPTLPGMVRPIFPSRQIWSSIREEGVERPSRRRSRGDDVRDEDRSLDARSEEARAQEPRPQDEIGVVIIELNANFLVHQLFPALVQRHLTLSGTTTYTGINYHVSIFSTTDPQHPFFESGPTLPRKEDKPDVEIGLIESPFVNNRPPQGQRPRNATDPQPPDPLRQSPVLRRYAMAFPAAMIPGRTNNWRLAVQHPAGSLKAAVASTRRANLMMSFGALVILAGSIVLLFVAMHRTRALAKMQMEFVAGVSHELRTPVSVICSAADNLAEGVVDGKPQVQNYGQLIRGEARRLASMVEQILLFSTGKQNTGRYNLQPVDIVAVIEGVLRDTSTAVTSAGMVLERSIDPDLPHVMADGGAVSRCLENLVSNAIKYGASGGWMRVSASLKTEDGNRRHRPEVAITVEDHGMGIASSDLRRIFEPFYRGKSAQDSQIHGTGLGLSLARKLARAMRGDIHVESEAGRGSCFTLTLPAAEMPTVTEHESLNEPVHTAD
jgi:signal transduction histidine kinase